jgi:WD40 repeat protein
LTSWGAVAFWPELRQLVVGNHLLGLASSSAREAPWPGANWLALAPDGTRAATVDSRGVVAFYRFGDPPDPTRPELVASRRAHQDHGRAIVFSPDGSVVASGSESIVLWDATTHEVIARLEHSAVVWSLAFHPEGRWLVSSHADGAILVWDTTERELVASFNEHARSVRAVAFSRDGRTVASGGEDRAVLVWDVRTGGRLALLASHETRVTGVAFLPDGGLVSSDQDGVIIVWDLERERPRSVLQPPPKGDASYSLAVSPDGTQLANTNGLLRLGAREPLVALHAGPFRRLGATYGVAFSPDGRRLAAVTDGGWLLLFETVQGRLLERRKVEETPVVAVTFSPDGRWLATGGDEGAVRLWSVSPLEDVAVLGRHEARIKSVAFSPEGDVVASAGDDRRIVLWEVASRRLRSTIGTHASPIYAIAFTPDGEQLVSGEHDRTVRVYTRERSLWGVRLD